MRNNKIFKIAVVILLIALVLQFLTSCQQLGTSKKVVDSTGNSDSSTVEVHTYSTNPPSDLTLDNLLDSLEQTNNNSTVEVLQPTTTYSSSQENNISKLYWLEVIRIKKQQDIEQLYGIVGKNYSIEKITQLADESNKYNETTYTNNQAFFDKLFISYVQGAARRINIDKDGVVTPVKDISQSTKIPKVK